MYQPKYLLKNTFFTAILFMASLVYAFGQKQQGIPQPRGPIDLNDTSNIVIFIVLPIIVIILYFVWKRATKKRKEKADDMDKRGR